MPSLRYGTLGRYAWSGVRQLALEVAEITPAIATGTNVTSWWRVQGAGVLMGAWEVPSLSHATAGTAAYYIVAIANTANTPAALRLWCADPHCAASTSVTAGHTPLIFCDI